MNEYSTSTQAIIAKDKGRASILGGHRQALEGHYSSSVESCIGHQEM